MQLSAMDGDRPQERNDFNMIRREEFLHESSELTRVHKDETMLDNVMRSPPARPAAGQNGLRRTNLESLHAWATRLLTIAKHDTMKDYLRLVMGDIEDGFQLLSQKNARDEPTMWTMVDLTTTRARLSLMVIADTFERAGTDAEFTPQTNRDAISQETIF
jgi:hypothetical protein